MGPRLRGDDVPSSRPEQPHGFVAFYVISAQAEIHATLGA